MKKSKVNPKIKLLGLLLIMFCSAKIFAQTENIGGIVNKYAKVTTIASGCPAKITVNYLADNPQNSNNHFNVDDEVLIIQMKGAEFVQTNNVNFGNLVNYNSAGNFEIGRIAGITGTNNEVITLYGGLINSYDVNSFVQLVKIKRVYGNAIVSSEIKGKSWSSDDGTGGIIIIFCDGELELNADINANGIGFKGGLGVKETNGNCWHNTNSSQFAMSNSGCKNGGYKGETYAIMNSNISLGRGKLLSGGGGGNDHNAGGGGGSNLGTGGQGGTDLNSNISQNFGLGGISNNYYNHDRIFLGGGGGGGHGNDEGGSNGGNGGGIIIIKSIKIKDAGVSGKIKTNGDGGGSQFPGPYGDDGAGGGGAGGTILLDVSLFDNCKIEALGGNGGNSMQVTDDVINGGLRRCGPGGGGGGGFIWVKGTSYTPSGLNLGFWWGGASGINTGQNNTSSNNNPGNDSYQSTGGNGGNLKINLVLPYNLQVCCVAGSQPEIYQEFPLSITNDMVLRGKYFVSGHASVTNATLDITNVDMVFDEDASIDFIGTATMRANNSVFRPCLQNRSWQGLFFNDGSKAIVNDCVFKNSNGAFYIVNNSIEGNINITGCEFSNCNIGIYIQNYTASKKFNGSITNNIFSIDKSEIQYIYHFGTTLNKFTGIVLDSKMQTTISQNTFINNGYNNSVTALNKDMIGIAIKNSGNAIITSNKFTNQEAGVSIKSVLNGKNIIENNSFELTYNLINTDIWNGKAQVYLANNNDVITVHNNKFVSLNINESINAIYANYSHNLEIKSNEIKGYSTPIYTFYSNDLLISDNTILDYSNTGISILGGDELTISCNNLNSKNKIGIHFWDDLYPTNTHDHELSILSNCIFNNDIPIQLNSNQLPGGASPFIPLVKNNYLYNYSTFGINLVNYSNMINGIGTDPLGPPVTFDIAGRNTFVSNSQTADDINSTHPVIENGNFNFQNPGTNVFSVTPKIEFASTSSCGHQIFNNNNNINQDLSCNETQGGGPLTGAFVSKDNKQSILPNFAEYYKKAEENQKVNLLLAFFNIYSSNNSIVNLDLMLSTYKLENVLNINERNLLKYFTLVNDGTSNETRIDFLNSFSNTDASIANFVKFEKMNLNLSSIKFGSDKLKNADAFLLANGINKDDHYYESAMEVIRFHRGDFFNITKVEEFPKIEINSDLRNLVKVGKDNFKIFPNPVTKVVNINYAIPSATTDIKIQISNTLGVIVKEIPVTSYYGLIELDFAAYTQGTYFVSFIANDKNLKTLKFIKI